MCRGYVGVRVSSYVSGVCFRYVSRHHGLLCMQFRGMFRGHVSGYVSQVCNPCALLKPGPPKTNKPTPLEFDPAHCPKPGLRSSWSILCTALKFSQRTVPTTITKLHLAPCFQIKVGANYPKCTVIFRSSWSFLVQALAPSYRILAHHDVILTGSLQGTVLTFDQQTVDASVNTALNVDA